jgi:hypothetical protein
MLASPNLVVPAPNTLAVAAAAAVAAAVDTLVDRTRAPVRMDRRIVVVDMYNWVPAVEWPTEQ